MVKIGKKTRGKKKKFRKTYKQKGGFSGLPAWVRYEGVVGGRSDVADNLYTLFEERPEFGLLVYKDSDHEGKSPFFEKHNGMTPLMIAVDYLKKEVVEWLVKNNKVDVNQTDDSKNDALYYAIEKLKVQIKGKQRHKALLAKSRGSTHTATANGSESESLEIRNIKNIIKILLCEVSPNRRQEVLNEEIKGDDEMEKEINAEVQRLLSTIESFDDCNEIKIEINDTVKDIIEGITNYNGSEIPKNIEELKEAWTSTIINHQSSDGTELDESSDNESSDNESNDGESSDNESNDGESSDDKVLNKAALKKKIIEGTLKNDDFENYFLVSPDVEEDIYYFLDYVLYRNHNSKRGGKKNHNNNTKDKKKHTKMKKTNKKTIKRKKTKKTKNHKKKTIKRR